MKKTISILVCLLFLAGCAGTASNTADNSPVVIDGAGTAHPVPENREAVKIASAYAVSVPFIAALELDDRVLAINVKSRFWTETVEGLADAGSVGRGVVDLEALAEFTPDVLIHRSNDTATVEAVTVKLGIPVFCITVEDYDDIIYTLIIMGDYFGVEQRAKEVCEWLTEKFGIIDDIVMKIPEARRVTALVMGGEPFRVAGSDMLQSWMVEKAGGISVVDTTNNRNWADIGVETVFRLDPDFIFCTSSTALNYSVEHLLTDSAWSAMTAVVNKNIYVIPAMIDSWDLPGINAALGTMYMLNKMYPEFFTLEELQHEIDDYYLFMFGKTFDSMYLGYDLEQ